MLELLSIISMSGVLQEAFRKEWHYGAKYNSREDYQKERRGDNDVSFGLIDVGVSLKTEH